MIPIFTDLFYMVDNMMKQYTAVGVGVISCIAPINI